MGKKKKSQVKKNEDQDNEKMVDQQPLSSWTDEELRIYKEWLDKHFELEEKLIGGEIGQKDINPLEAKEHLQWKSTIIELSHRQFEMQIQKDKNVLDKLSEKEKKLHESRQERQKFLRWNAIHRDIEKWFVDKSLAEDTLSPEQKEEHDKWRGFINNESYKLRLMKLVDASLFVTDERKVNLFPLIVNDQLSADEKTKLMQLLEASEQKENQILQKYIQYLDTVVDQYYDQVSPNIDFKAMLNDAKQIFQDLEMAKIHVKEKQDQKKNPPEDLLNNL